MLIPQYLPEQTYPTKIYKPYTAAEWAWILFGKTENVPRLKEEMAGFFWYAPIVSDSLPQFLKKRDNSDAK